MTDQHFSSLSDKWILLESLWQSSWVLFALWKCRYLRKGWRVRISVRRRASDWRVTCSLCASPFQQLLCWLLRKRWCLGACQTTTHKLKTNAAPDTLHNKRGQKHHKGTWVWSLRSESSCLAMWFYGLSTFHRQNNWIYPEFKPSSALIRVLCDSARQKTSSWNLYQWTNKERAKKIPKFVNVQSLIVCYGSNCSSPLVKSNVQAWRKLRYRTQPRLLRKCTFPKFFQMHEQWSEEFWWSLKTEISSKAELLNCRSVATSTGVVFVAVSGASWRHSSCFCALVHGVMTQVGGGKPTIIGGFWRKGTWFDRKIEWIWRVESDCFFWRC